MSEKMAPDLLKRGALGGTRTPNLLIRSYVHIPAKPMYTQVWPYVSVRRCTGPA
jgi:hypothetical protein